MRAGPEPIRGEVSAALHSPDPKRIDLLLAHCAELPKVGARKPVFERLRDKLGAP